MRSAILSAFAVLLLLAGCGEGEKMAALDIYGSQDWGSEDGSGNGELDILTGDNSKIDEDVILWDWEGIDVCVPACEGKECGDDGCGGLCGKCPGCDGEHDETLCEQGMCMMVCCPVCDDMECGSDGCGGACGICDEGFVCNNGGCYPEGCVASCIGKECGADGCGGSCGVCDDGFECVDGGCIADEITCETLCEGMQCGLLSSEDGMECDCGSCPPTHVCTDGQCIPEGCEPQCDGIQCGDDGCGGSCGACPAGSQCYQSFCLGYQTACDQACEGMDCDYASSVFGTHCPCGECLDSEECIAGLCEPVACEPQCAGKECGDDGCGGSCGSCGGGACVNGFCSCLPNCANKQCGDDGCGGSCGVCIATEECISGVCVDNCNVFELQFPDSDPVQKVTTLGIGDGHAGGGLDVDGNSSTCAPSGSCDGGVDNSLSGLMSSLSSFIDVQAEIDSILNQGDLILLAVLDNMTTNGTPFDLSFYMGSPVSAGCNVQTQSCHYFVDSASIDPDTCLAYLRFDNATVTNGLLQAGGPGYYFEMELPMAGIPLNLMMRMARIQATVSGSGASMQLLNGILAGAIPKAELMAAIENLPADVVAGLPVSLDMVINLLNMMLKADIDTDGDGVAESVSAGLLFESRAGAIDGVQ